jgi:hypothetical protein
MASEHLALPPELLGNVERYAVYRCFSDGGELLYVGESGELGKRLATHAQKAWFVQVRGITLEWYADEIDALNAERRAIHVEHPKYNIQHRNTATLQPAGGRRGSRRPGSRVVPSAALPRTWDETRLMALKILDKDPGISASELGRRLGRTEGRGRQIKRELTQATPQGPDEEAV